MGGLSFLWSIIIGIAAGAIAGLIMKGKGFGMFINLLVGLVGGLLGGWIYHLMGFHTGSKFGILIMSVIGATALLWIISFFKGNVNAK